MSYKTEEIKKGIKLHVIETNKFKTNLLAVFITVPLSRETVTLNTVIPAVLKRGTANLDSQEKISIELENMYGSSFDCGIEKIGDNHVIKFYLESLNDNFIPNDAGISAQSYPGVYRQEPLQEQLQKSINLLLDVIFNPLLIDDGFKEEYVNSEKNNIKTLIESKIDNKDVYSLTRCTEEMYKEQAYGLYKYGYSEDLERITAKSLYDYYISLINDSKIDIFVSGEIEKEQVLNSLKNNNNISKLNAREAAIAVNNEQTEIKDVGTPQTIVEKMDVGQGKLVIGLDVILYEKDSKFPISIYNVILRRKCNI